MTRRLLQCLAAPRVLAVLFLLFALPTGLGCALLAPVGMFPDEFAHASRADALRHGEIFGSNPPPGFPDYTISKGVMIDIGIRALLFSQEYTNAFPDKPVHQDDRLAARTIPWIPGSIYYPTQMVEYFPILYTPGALALLAGQAAGMQPVYAFYLGRVAMLLAFLALGAGAIGLARTGNGLIFAVLTLPTTVNLASSYNQDGLLTACCALAAALLTRRTRRAWWAALMLLIAALSAKTPYLALLLFCLPPLQAPGLARRAGLVALACVPPALWVLHCTRTGFIAYQRAPYHPGPLWPGPRDTSLTHIDPHANLLVLLAHPAQIVLLPIVTLIRNWDITWHHLLGMVSCDTVLIWGWEYPCLVAALGSAALGSLRGPAVAEWRGLDAGFAALALFGGFIGMEMAMYLTFTRAGRDSIEGVQARYFLPLLPFFIFLLPWAGRATRVARLPRLAPGWYNLPAVAMAGVNAIALPAYIFHLFHMPGP